MFLQVPCTNTFWSRAGLKKTFVFNGLGGFERALLIRGYTGSKFRTNYQVTIQ